MINSALGVEEEVLEEVREIPEVMGAHMVYGVCDIIARVEADTVQEVKDVTLFKIRRIENVRSVTSLMCA